MIEADNVRKILSYDPDTGIMTWVAPSKYHREKVGSCAGAKSSGGSGKFYFSVSINGKKYKRSRLAFAWMTGRWPTACIDHINGDSLDDRWINLREATVTQNAWNHKRRAKSSHLPMGVRALGHRFQARLAVNSKTIHLGSFATASEASVAYQTARRKYYGEFA